MSCLDATFTLTPRSPSHYKEAHDQAMLHCFGADFLSFGDFTLSSLYETDRFYFNKSCAADPTLDYSQWPIRMRSSHLMLSMDLQKYGIAHKEVALIFGFDLLSSLGGQVLVYSDAGLLHDQKLVPGDHQFLLELETVSQPLYLYFIHADGDWFFRGISAYVA
jgi:hypothetical protein